MPKTPTAPEKEAPRKPQPELKLPKKPEPEIKYPTDPEKKLLDNIGATEDQVSDTPAPSGNEYKDEPKQG